MSKINLDEMIELYKDNHVVSIKDEHEIANKSQEFKSGKNVFNNGIMKTIMDYYVMKTWKDKYDATHCKNECTDKKVSDINGVFDDDVLEDEQCAKECVDEPCMCDHKQNVNITSDCVRERTVDKRVHDINELTDERMSIEDLEVDSFEDYSDKVVELYNQLYREISNRVRFKVSEKFEKEISRLKNTSINVSELIRFLDKRVIARDIMIIARSLARCYSDHRYNNFKDFDEDAFNRWIGICESLDMLFKKYDS